MRERASERVCVREGEASAKRRMACAHAYLRRRQEKKKHTLTACPPTYGAACRIHVEMCQAACACGEARVVKLVYECVCRDAGAGPDVC